MRAIVYPGANGVISQAGKIIGQAVDADAVIVELDSLDLPPMSAARLKADGSVEIVANWIGSGPWYDQAASTADRMTPIHINDLGINPEAQGLRMEPRPETAAEKKANEKAVADAAKAAETESRNARTITPPQFNKAMILSGLKSEFRAALTAAGKTEVEIDIAMADIEYAWEPMRFDNPKFIASATMLGKTEADREAFWQLATSL